jgi:hypothetical protein
MAHKAAGMPFRRSNTPARLNAVAMTNPVSQRIGGTVLITAPGRKVEVEVGGQSASSPRQQAVPARAGDLACNGAQRPIAPGFVLEAVVEDFDDNLSIADAACEQGVGDGQSPVPRRPPPIGANRTLLHHEFLGGTDAQIAIVGPDQGGGAKGEGRWAVVGGCRSRIGAINAVRPPRSTAAATCDHLQRGAARPRCRPEEAPDHCDGAKGDGRCSKRRWRPEPQYSDCRESMPCRVTPRRPSATLSSDGAAPAAAGNQEAPDQRGGATRRWAAARSRSIAIT